MHRVAPSIRGQQRDRRIAFAKPSQRGFPFTWWKMIERSRGGWKPAINGLLKRVGDVDEVPEARDTPCQAGLTGWPSMTPNLP